MTRYQTCRKFGFDPLTSICVCLLNTLWGIPKGYFGIMNLIVEYPIKD